MKENKVCYVCCFYFGDRRSSTETYNRDRLSYLKQQILDLSEFKHNLDRIIFVFNLAKNHLEIFESFASKIPSQIQNTKVDIICRENIGLSYGGWSEAFSIYKNSFDYYIFNEDDYFINDHDFDSYLVNKFNSYSNIGYLAGMVTNPFPGNPLQKPYAGNSFGISSYKVLNHIYAQFGFLPHDKNEVSDLESRYGSGEEKGQISQTYEMFKLKYSLFDIREDYSTPHDMGRSRKDIDSPHIIERFFSWNKKSLIVPASMKFMEDFYIINIIDPQYQSKKSCYVVNFYFGNRRRTIDEYHKDPLCFLKKQIELLNDISHNLTKIIFTINVEIDHYKILSWALKIIPKKIKNAEVDVLIRENLGLSYGAFSDAFETYREFYDYFIFNEDDYFPIEENWDEYLIRKYNSLPNSGYLSAMTRESDVWNKNRRHAGHCFGISSTKNLNIVFEKYGGLPHSRETNNYSAQEEVQIQFTQCFEEVGLRNYDIREEYRVSFARTEPDTEDIWRWFWWNERDLIVPAIIIFNHSYSWYESFDGPCVKKSNL